MVASGVWRCLEKLHDEVALEINLLSFHLKSLGNVKQGSAGGMKKRS